MPSDSPLAEILRRRIAVEGPLSVGQYMAEALGHPRHGYYIKRDPLGEAGDFVTAPEVSQMFGELLGLWCAQCWLQLDRPSPVRLIELGPGRGTLMADALRASLMVPGFREAAEVHLVENSPALRARQAEALKESTPIWHETLDRVPDGPLLIVANEFFDALPVRQFEKTAAGWRERLIGWDDATRSLAFTVSAHDDPARLLAPAARDDAPVGSIAELCTPGIGVAATLGRRIATWGGAGLIVDYGHAHPTLGDTLQAVRRHRFSDPLDGPGDADLTAHVDFAALATTARQNGACPFGPVSQATLLHRLGIRERAATLMRTATPAQAEGVTAAVARLTKTGQMGDHFKALALTSPALGRPPGF